jgi:radical SAM superfamily enzyme YgiQ (UPF0313 family)
MLLTLSSMVEARTTFVAPDLPGDRSKVVYDSHRNVYIDRNTWFDLWTLGLPDDHPIRKSMRGEAEYPPVAKTEWAVRKDLPAGSASKPRSMACSKSRKSKFVLINVEQTLNEMQSDQTGYRVWPHLGLIFVGTAANMEGWDVVMWDELVKGPVPLDTLVESGDIVGLSLVVTGIERGISLARQAKALGAKHVIAGNDSAIFRANQVMSQSDRPIDAVFTTNSVAAVRKFFREIVRSDIRSLDIPGVQLTTGCEPRSNEPSRLKLELASRKDGAFDKDDVFIVPKLDLYPHWDEVWRNYRATFGHKHSNPDTVKNAIALFAQGCTRTRGTDVCSYCTIAGVADIRVPSEDVLARSAEAYKNFGIDMVFNVTDSAYEMADLVRKLQALGIGFPAMTIYGRAQGIARNPRLLTEWRKVATERLLVNVGMDSGSDDMLLRGVVKSSVEVGGSRIEENREAVKRIREAGAHLHYSLIFGSPGESKETCEKSIEFLEWTVAELGHQLDICETDIYWLNFGSPASRVYKDFDYARYLASLAGKEISVDQWTEGFARFADELVTPISVEKAWYRFFTRIDFDTAQAYNERAAQIMAVHTGSIRGRAFRPV